MPRLARIKGTLEEVKREGGKKVNPSGVPPDIIGLALLGSANRPAKGTIFYQRYIVYLIGPSRFFHST